MTTQKPKSWNLPSGIGKTFIAATVKFLRVPDAGKTIPTPAIGPVGKLVSAVRGSMYEDRRRIKATARRVLLRQASAAERAQVFDGWTGKAAKRGDGGARIALLLPRPGRVRLTVDPTPTTFLETTLAIGLWLLEDPDVRAQHVRQCYYVRCNEWFFRSTGRGRADLYCPDKDCEELARELRKSTDPSDRKDRQKQLKKKGSYRRASK